jgi:hypothetical protein
LDSRRSARHEGEEHDSSPADVPGAKRVEAMMPMKKIDIATIEAARRG